MPCTHCPHCRELAELADLRLTTRPRAGGQGGIDRAFYRDFATRYILARARSATPGVLLRNANPGLTASQCRDYVRRARDLGFLDGVRNVPVTPVRVDEPGPVPGAVSSVEELGPTMRQWLDDTRRALAGQGFD